MRLLFVLLLFTVPLAAQNLVQNPGFEIFTPGTAFKPCSYLTESSRHFERHVKGWTAFVSSTPDLLVYDSAASCGHLPPPHSGNGMLGLILYHPAVDLNQPEDYHEFVQASLSKPLEPGVLYRFSCWWYTADTLGVQHLNAVYGRNVNVRPVVSNHLGAYFSNISLPTSADPRSQPIRPQVQCEPMFEQQGKWVYYSDTFRVSEPCRYFLVGNFTTDLDTRTNLDSLLSRRMDAANAQKKGNFFSKKKRIAYYLFDDFVVEQELEGLAAALQARGVYTFDSDLLFASGSAKLSAGATPVLDQLLAYFQTHPQTRLAIEGHTDNVGGAAANRRLSEDRAANVFRFLVENGVPATQLTFKGLGASQPADSNETATGRQRNRRVEIRLQD